MKIMKSYSAFILPYLLPVFASPDFIFFFILCLSFVVGVLLRFLTANTLPILTG